MPLLIDAIAFAQEDHPAPPRYMKISPDKHHRFCQNSTNAAAVARVVFSRGWMQANAPRIQYIMHLQPAAYRILKNATSFFNLSQNFCVDATYDDEGYFNAESIDRFLGDMLKPTVLCISSCKHPSINDAFVRNVILAKYGGTLEVVRLFECPSITPAAQVALLRAPASYRLRCQTCNVIVMTVEDDDAIQSLYSPDIFRACIEMMDERADTSGNLCSMACYLLDHFYSRHVVQPTLGEVSSMLSRIVWMLDFDNIDVVTNATCLLSSLVQERATKATMDAVVASGIAPVVISLLRHISGSGGVARIMQQHRAMHNSLKALSLIIAYLSDHDRVSDITGLLTRHHLLEVVQTLADKYCNNDKLRAAVAQDTDLQDAISCIFMLVDDMTHLPQLPNAIEFAVKLLPACAGVVRAYFKDHADWDDMSDLTTAAASPIISLPTFVPHDISLSFEAEQGDSDDDDDDDGSNDSDSDVVAHKKAVAELSRRTDRQREDEMRLRLRHFNDTLDACDRAAAAAQGGGGDGEHFGAEIYERFIEYAARLCWDGFTGPEDEDDMPDDETVEKLNASRAASRAMLMLTMLAQDPGVKEAAKMQRALALQRAAGGPTAASSGAASNDNGGSSNHHAQRRRARVEDDVQQRDDDMETLRSRAAAHLLQIFGGAASRGEDSRVLKACVIFMRNETVFSTMDACAGLLVSHVGKDVFETEGLEFVDAAEEDDNENDNASGAGSN